MSDTESSSSGDEEGPLNFLEISNTSMGKTNVKYCPTKFLGKGRSAIVFPGYHFGILKPTAVKLIEKQYLRSDEEHINELKIWSNIDQSINIIRLYDSFRVKKGGMFLAMELAERTFREQIIDQSPQRDEIVKWLHQVVSAVEYLHEKGVIHRDIKPDNILMVLKDGDKIIAKLGDFGVSKMLSNAERSGTFSNANGTVLWMPPEAIKNQAGKFKNTRMLDIYALGMLIFFGLSLGGHPFSNSDSDDLSKVLSDMTSETAKPFELEINEIAANDLISKMLQRLPESRPGILEVRSHCFFWNWEQEQQFLIRSAICLSKKGCPVIENIKEEVDQKYALHYQNLNKRENFNWIDIAAQAQSMDIPDLFFKSPERKKPTKEYGNGESVTKFLKFFRDKYVHYPDMKPEATTEFSESEGIFCEEKYVSVLTSICPGLSSILYRVLQIYADEPSVMPLSRIYFQFKLTNLSKPSQVKSNKPMVEEVEDEQDEVQENVERLGNSDIYIFKDSYISDNIKRGYYRRPSMSAAIKVRKMSSADEQNYVSNRSAWWNIWLVDKGDRSSFLLSVYSIVELYRELHIAMELASSSLYLEITNQVIKMPEDANQITNYLHNIAEAVGWLHEKSIPHQKITPRNVLIFNAYKNRKIAKLGISDPCSFKVLPNEEREALEMDISQLGHLINFSFYGENQFIGLKSSKMFIVNNLVKWMIQDSNKPVIWQVLDHPIFWDDEKSLQFICDFSHVLQRTVIRWDAKIMNPNRNAYFYTETTNELYKWVEKVDSRLLKGLHEKGLTDFPSLLELIEKIVRLCSGDKENSADMSKYVDEDVIKELFYNESNAFCKRKVFCYFIEIFPELIILCFGATLRYQLNNWQLLHKYTKQSCDKKLDYSAWRNKMPTIIY